MVETGRALTSVAALAAFLVGVPAANIATGGAPDHLVPVELPDPHDSAAVWEALRWSYMDGHLVPWLAHIAAWLGWGLGVVLVLLDIARLLRAGSAALHRHLAARTPRAWITSAVASALILLSASNAVAQPAGPAVVATDDHQPQPHVPVVDAFHVPDDVHPDCPRHEVVHGDTYWALAEQHLGDGRRYVEIDALNRDRIPDPRELLPGMRVLLPPDADHLVQPVPAGVREVVVQPGESASSIAEREYGDAAAWIRLWDLNHDRPQPDGRAWRNPDLLLPGWHLLITEAAAMSATPPPRATPMPPASGNTSPPPTTPPARPSPNPAATPSPATTTPAPVPDAAGGIDLGNGVFVGLGVAVAVTAAMLTIRTLHRRDYRIGSRRRADLHQPVAPVVRALRTTHDHIAQQNNVPTLPPQSRPAQDIAVELAAKHGLGLRGAGADAAVRALLVRFLSEPGAQVIIAESDLIRLLGCAAADLDHPRLLVTSSLNAALETAKTEWCERLEILGPTALIATPTSDNDPRLGQLLESTRVAVILLGRCPGGTTAELGPDGTVTGTDAPELLNTRLFVLPAGEAADVLRLLAAAQPSPVTIEQSSPTPTADVSAPAIQLDVLGAVRLTYNGPDGAVDITAEITPKQRELLAFLACHPDGAHRDVLNAALWPNATANRPYNNMHYTLSTLRKTIARATSGHVTDLVLGTGGRYRVDPAVGGTDYAALQASIVRGPQSDALVGLDLYRGDLAEDISALWLDTPREALRRDVLDALNNLARTENQPAARLELLEKIRVIDPYSEENYREIMRAQAQLGHRAAISRTFDLMVNKLREIDERPAGETVALAEKLQALVVG
jgi:DNA-binding SARP family transcriptional activator